MTALHIVVYDATPDNLLLYKIFLPGDTVELEVPSGENRIFAIWGETTPGIAKYYGVSGPVDVGGDGTEDVSISMQEFTVSASVFNMMYNKTTDTLVWNNIYGTTNYEISFVPAVGGPAQIYYSGVNNSYDYSGYMQGDFKIKVYSSILNLTSGYSPVKGF